MFRSIAGWWFLMGMASLLLGQTYVPSRLQPPTVPREFRGAWVAVVYNIDWPSSKGLGASTQKAQLRAILDKMASLRLNAVIFQVRPQADAVYRSGIEPWSPWLSGTMGKSPGYDPLAYCIQEAHRRGIEVHAWFNPFRALPNRDHAVSSNHVTRTHPGVIRDFKQLKWMDPGSSFTQQRALAVMLDVVNRYDVDGVHIDDYFYPYPTVKNGRATPAFPDGKTAAQRRSYTNSFVKQMYANIKKRKPWVRVGISPFGIWKPGVPSGTTAGLSAYEHLAADSRKWLSSGWCDYLAPQLYWRIEGPQSYTRLLSWWRQQGSRPVWPGIATARIKSSEDPGRPAGEIINQVALSRSIGRNYAGHIHWSAKALMQNRGGVCSSLATKAYGEPALVPPMPWITRQAPATPSASVRVSKGNAEVRWRAVAGASNYAVQARYGQRWVLASVTRGSSVTLKGSPSVVAVSAANRYGNTSKPIVLERR